MFNLGKRKSIFNINLKRAKIESQTKKTESDIEKDYIDEQNKQLFTKMNTLKHNLNKK